MRSYCLSSLFFPPEGGKKSGDKKQLFNFAAVRLGTNSDSFAFSTRFSNRVNPRNLACLYMTIFFMQKHERSLVF